MNPDMERFLNLAVKPARLTKTEAAWLLGFGEGDLAVLIARGILKPLGHPAVNGQKFFLTSMLEDLRRDEKWFSKASDAIIEYWSLKNGRKEQCQANRTRVSRSSDEASVLANARG
jgi:hypothetical protein